jgi:hypothetical protein
MGNPIECSITATNQPVLNPAIKPFLYVLPVSTKSGSFSLQALLFVVSLESFSTGKKVLTPIHID